MGSSGLSGSGYLALQKVCVQGRVTGSQKISRHTGQRQSWRVRVDSLLPPLPDILTLDMMAAVLL